MPGRRGGPGAVGAGMESTLGCSVGRTRQVRMVPLSIGQGVAKVTRGVTRRNGEGWGTNE